MLMQLHHSPVCVLGWTAAHARQTPQHALDVQIFAAISKRSGGQWVSRTPVFGFVDRDADPTAPIAQNEKPPEPFGAGGLGEFRCEPTFSLDSRPGTRLAVILRRDLAHVPGPDATNRFRHGGFVVAVEDHGRQTSLRSHQHK